MMELDEFLDFASNNDEYELLKVKQVISAPTADDRLLSKFNEINDFVAANNREPNENISDPIEYMRFASLKSIRGNSEQCASLREFDIHELIPKETEGVLSEPESKYQSDVTDEAEVPSKEIEFLDDIFLDDAFGILDDDAESIFTIRNLPKTIDMPNRIASRKRCEYFEQFEHLFKACHADLKSAERELHKFTGEQQIQRGQFFVLNGVMCYVADMEERIKKNGKNNAKLHLIFENGTESGMLLRSLATELYKDETGRRILLKSDNALDGMLGVQDDDQVSGYIYILQSLSTNIEIKDVRNLYKIGYATTSVEKRIANAEKEPTYLMAAVHHVSSYKCFNMNTQKFESLLHTFFGKACLDVEVADNDGKMCKPREWFVAPLQAIETAIQLLINGEIVNYRFDELIQEVVLRNE
jgi:hypothetical protein